MTTSAPGVSIGDLIDRKYRVEQVLGQGGMGLVVGVRHVSLGERYAIKILLDRDDVTLRKRFMREATAAANLNHEHVARVFDVGTLPGGAPYMVMELLDGEDLDARVQRLGPMELREAVTYLAQACDGLARAHGLGLVHRDIKPSNLFLTHRHDGVPVVKVLDFGISKDSVITGDARITRLTRDGALLGSPNYMAPEQLLSSGDVDPRADIWSLGATLFELLTNAPAFDGTTMTDLFTAILRDDPRQLSELRPELPAAIDQIIGRCLEKDADDRYATVAELVEDLRPFADEHATSSQESISANVAPVAPTLAGRLPASQYAAPPTGAPATTVHSHAGSALGTAAGGHATTQTVGVADTFASALPSSMQSRAGAPPPPAPGDAAAPTLVSRPYASPQATTLASAAPQAAAAAVAGRQGTDRRRWPWVVGGLLVLSVALVGAGMVARGTATRSEGKTASKTDTKKRSKTKKKSTARDPEELPESGLTAQQTQAAERLLARAEDHLTQREWEDARTRCAEVVSLVESAGLRLGTDDSPLAARAMAIRADTFIVPLIQAGRHDASVQHFWNAAGLAEQWNPSGSACTLQRRLASLDELALALSRSDTMSASAASNFWRVLIANYDVITQQRPLPPACLAKLRPIVAHAKAQVRAQSP